MKTSKLIYRGLAHAGRHRKGGGAALAAGGGGPQGFLTPFSVAPLLSRPFFLLDEFMERMMEPLGMATMASPFAEQQLLGGGIPTLDVNMETQKDKYLLHCQLEGLQKSDVQLQVDQQDKILYITASVQRQSKKQWDEKGNLLEEGLGEGKQAALEGKGPAGIATTEPTSSSSSEKLKTLDRTGSAGTDITTSQMGGEGAVGAAAAGAGGRIVQHSFSGSISRAVRLPEDSDVESLSAEMQEGSSELLITINRLPEQQVPQQIKQVEIK